SILTIPAVTFRRAKRQFPRKRKRKNNIGVSTNEIGCAKILTFASAYHFQQIYWSAFFLQSGKSCRDRSRGMIRG
ncbi:MAG: hypothetical protein ACXWMC_00120, partial [Syntrophales bacterium]